MSNGMANAMKRGANSSLFAQGGTWLFAASIVYLLCELMFNAALIDAVASRNAASLEIYGRCLAAVGAGLLAVRMRGGLARHLTRWTPIRLRNMTGRACTLAFFVVGVAVGYLGQQLILNVAVASVSSQERQAAPDIALLEGALITGTVTLGDLNNDIEASLPGYMTYITLLGYTSWDNDQDIAMIRAERSRIKAHLAKSELTSEIASLYQTYESQMAAARSSYEQLLSKREEYKGQVARVAGQYVDTLNWFVNYRNGCDSDQCRLRADQKYKERVVEVTGHYVPWQTFCSELPDRVEYYQANGRIQKRRVDGGHDCSGITPALITARLRQSLAADAPDIPADFSAFVAQHAGTGSAAAQHLWLKAVDLQPGWDQRTFATQLFAAIERQAFERPDYSASALDQITRAVLIPPLAITFSLMFSLLNLVGIVKQRLVPRNVRGRYVAGGFAAFFVLVGLSAPANGVITGIGGVLVDWVVHYETLIYPFGSTLMALF